MKVHRFSKMIGWMSVLDLHTRLLYRGFLLFKTEKLIVMFHGSALLQWLTGSFDQYCVLQWWSIYPFSMSDVNAPFLLYWNIILFAMSLVSSSKLLFGRDIPAQKFSHLINVFDRLKLYNLTATYKGNAGWVFLLCCLWEDIPLFFMLYLK